jgi:hypothetical protein
VWTLDQTLYSAQRKENTCKQPALSTGSMVKGEHNMEKSIVTGSKNPKDNSPKTQGDFWRFQHLAHRETLEGTLGQVSVNYTSLML